MNDTTTFWASEKIGLDRTIWSLVDVDGFVLETQYQNGIKKVIKDINFQDVLDTFFTKEIAKIKTYKVPFPDNLTITPQILIWLDNFIESPYFITKKDITVLKEKSAFELYLFSGDVRKLGYGKAMAKRAIQD